MKIKTLFLSSAVLFAPLILLGGILQGTGRTYGDYHAFISLCSKSWESFLGFAIHNNTMFIAALMVLFGFSFIRGLSFFVRQIRTTKRLHESMRRKGIDQSICTEKHRVVVVDDSAVYAITAGFIRPTIYLSTAIIKRLSKKELRSVIVHEKYHQKHNHPLALLLINTLRSFFFFVPVFKNIASYITLCNEYQADQESIKITSYSSLVSALLKTIEGEEKQAGFPASVSAFACTAERVAYIINNNADRPRFSLASLSVALSLGVIVFMSYILLMPQTGHAHQEEGSLINGQSQAQNNICHDLNYSLPLSFMNKNQSELNPTSEFRQSRNIPRDFVETGMTQRIE